MCNAVYLRLMNRYFLLVQHWAMASSFASFLDHTQRRTTVGRTPLDGLYLTTLTTDINAHDLVRRGTAVGPAL